MQINTNEHFSSLSDLTVVNQLHTHPQGLETYFSNMKTHGIQSFNLGEE